MGGQSWWFGKWHNIQCTILKVMCLENSFNLSNFYTPSYKVWCISFHTIFISFSFHFHFMDKYVFLLYTYRHGCLYVPLSVHFVDGQYLLFAFFKLPTCFTHRLNFFFLIDFEIEIWNKTVILNFNFFDFEYRAFLVKIRYVINTLIILLARY